MKKSKNKITREIQLMIFEKAKSLPVTPRFDSKGAPVYKRMPIDGAIVAASGVLDANGREPVPSVLYMANVLQYVDHHKELINAYQIEGIDGINYYCSQVLANHKRKEAYVDMNQKQPWHMRMIGYVLDFLTMRKLRGLKNKK